MAVRRNPLIEAGFGAILQQLLSMGSRRSAESEAAKDREFRAQQNQLDRESRTKAQQLRFGQRDAERQQDFERGVTERGARQLDPVGLGQDV